MGAAAAELVERDAELALIGARLGRVRHGEAAFVVLEGDPGVGKTSVLEAACRTARDDGMRVLAGRGSDLETEFAFGVVRQALEPAVAGRDDLFAGRAALAASVVGGPKREGPDASEGTLHGLYWLVAGLAEEEPLLLAVDDLHWADAESLAFLRFLAVRLASMRVGVLATTRPSAGDERAAALLADPAVGTIGLAPLGASGTARLLADRLGTPPDASFTAAAHEATGGNPFLLDQLAQALHAEGLAPVAQHAARVATLRPAGLARAVAARLEPGVRALARALAILGDGTALGPAAQLAGLTSEAADRAADALAAVGFLADERPLRFRHALLRGAVLAGMRAGEQRRGHHAAIALLRSAEADAERVAAHLLRIEPRGDPADAVTLQDAADLAWRRGAPTSAALVLERLLAEPLDPGQRHRALMALGEAEFAVGRGTAADRFIAAAALAPDEPGRRTAAIRAGHAAALDEVRIAPALALLEDVQAVQADRDGTMQLLNARLSAVWSEFEPFHEIAAEAAALGPIAGETPAESMVLGHLAREALQTGAPAAVVSALLDGALRHESLEQTTWFVPTMIGLAAVDRHDEAERVADRVIERARRQGRLTAYALAHVWKGRIAWQRGDLARAEELARAATEVAGERQWWTLIALSVLVEALVDRGEVAEAHRVWADAGLADDVPRHRALHQLLHARSRVRHAEGDAAGALEDLREMDRRVGEHARRSVNWLALRLRTAELLHATGAVDEALADARAAVDLAQRFGSASAVGAALRVHGRLTEEEDVLTQAVERLAASPARLDHARALLDLGALRRRRGARAAAREPLRAGYELAIGCGATGDADRARAELAASGVHVERLPGARGDDLTASERRIATLAAGGATNKEIAQALFITVKTVEMHLSAAYRKLDVRSRRELPTALGF